MGRVLAVGVFDILDPGHLAYLDASANLGDELVVLVVRDDAISGSCVVSETNRVIVVDALGSVDRAVLQPPGHVTETFESIKPTTIALAPLHDVDSSAFASLAAEVDSSITVTRVQYQHEPRYTRIHRATEPMVIDAIVEDISSP